MILFNTLRRILYFFVLFTGLVFAAADYSDIQQLVKEKKFEQALKMTEGQLSLNPEDIKLLFLKGLVLTRLDRLSEAEQVFLDITRTHPELPEPYNNLAVVYAAQGKFSEAEQALKNAINTHPSYATAHENLGDIYAKMASRAYNQALELDTSNDSARSKLSLVNELISEPGTEQAEAKPAAKTVAAAPAPAVEPKPIPTQPEIITIPAKQEPQPVKAPAKKEEKIIPPPPPAEKQVAAADEALRQNRQRVERAVRDWAEHWSSQDVDGYLASYADEKKALKLLEKTSSFRPLAKTPFHIETIGKNTFFH